MTMTADTTTTPDDDPRKRRRAELEAELAALDAHDAAVTRRRDLARACAEAPDAASALPLCVALATAIDREGEAERACEDDGRASAEADPTPAASPAAASPTAAPTASSTATTEAKPKRQRRAKAAPPLSEADRQAAAQGPFDSTPVDPWKTDPAACAKGFWDLFSSDFVAGHLASLSEGRFESLEEIRGRALRATSLAEFDAAEADARALLDGADGAQTAVVPFAPEPESAGAEAGPPQAPPGEGVLFPDAARTPTAQSEGA